MNDNVLLRDLVAAVQQSTKYKSVSSELISRIGAQELARRPNLKAATRATRNKLHQLGGAFLDYKPNFPRCREQLEQASRVDAEALRTVCLDLMTLHSSTRERLPILDDFYKETLAGIAPIRSVADFASGLNPLAAAWMPLADDADYYAYDIYQDMIDFHNYALPVLGVRGHAEVCDVLQLKQTPRTDVAFVLKAIPCLEQLDKSAGVDLLKVINADHILVSFPIRSLCGRNKGMAAHYEDRFRESIVDRQWTVTRFEFETELAFRLSR